MNLLLFSVGAALGAPIRFWIDNKFRAKYKFPIGILIVNILGSFLALNETRFLQLPSSL